MSGQDDVGSNLLGQSSVVPDLMRVYESLTQSSTPQPAAAAGGSTASPVAAASAAAAAAAAVESQEDDPSTMPLPIHGRPGKQLTLLAQAPPNVGSDGQVSHSPISTSAAAAAAASPEEEEEPPAATGNRRSRSSTRKRGRATESSSSTAGSRGGGDSSRSSSPRSRKKTTKADGRWSKRFQWPDELHREFVAAVFDVGLKHASPSALLEFLDSSAMTANGGVITSERVKSHLQKYRLHRGRSKREFLASYDAAVAKMRRQKRGYLADEDEISALAGGEVAAHLTCVASATDDAHAAALPPVTANDGGGEFGGGKAAAAAATSASGNVLHLPRLTEEEKRSPIGASMGYLMGLFFALQQQLSHQRAVQQVRQQEQHLEQEEQLALPSPPSTNPAGPSYDAYVAPQEPQQQHQQQYPPQSHHHHTPFGTPSLGHHRPGQQPIETSTSAILEENSWMERDMRAQRKFQDQMRAFRDQEVAKVQHVHQHQPQDQHHHDAFAEAVRDQDSAFAAAVSTSAGEISHGEGGLPQQPDAAAVTAAAPLPLSSEDRARSSSIGLSDADFWDATLDDDGLFDFLTGM